MFLGTLILYILYESPLYERNLNTMMDMILECKVSEDSYDENRMDILFGELEQRDPHHPAVLQYRSFKLGSAKTLSSIMVTAVSNLHMLQSAAFAEMIATDEMFLPKLGVEKRAIFCVIPDNDDTFNFMVALVFAALHFGVLGAFGLDGHIPAVILADQILESHIHTSGIALVLIAVKIIVDGNEPGVKQREHTLNEIASLNAVSPKPGKVFLCQVGTKKILRIYKPFIGGQPPVNGLRFLYALVPFFVRRFLYAAANASIIGVTGSSLSGLDRYSNRMPFSRNFRSNLMKEEVSRLIREVSRVRIVPMS